MKNRRNVTDAYIAGDVAGTHVSRNADWLRRLYFITDGTPCAASIEVNHVKSNIIGPKHIVHMHNVNGLKVYRLDLFEADADLPLPLIAFCFTELEIGVLFQKQEKPTIAKFAWQLECFDRDVRVSLAAERMEYAVKTFGQDNTLIISSGMCGLRYCHCPDEDNRLPYFGIYTMPLREEYYDGTPIYTEEMMLQKLREDAAEFDSWFPKS